MAPPTPESPAATMNALVAELAIPDVVGIALTGSYARGDATPESDVDVLIFASELPSESEQRYRLVVRDDLLFSLTTTTIAAKREELIDPEKAIAAVPGLRQMRLLRDPTSALAALQAEAVAWVWEPLRPAAARYASEALMGFAEEAHKVLGALRFPGPDAAATIAYNAPSLLYGMTRAVAVARGLLVPSDNVLFRLVQDAIGPDSAWSRTHRLLAGMEPPPGNGATDSIEARGHAALTLYAETAALLDALVLPRHREVIERAVGRIQSLPGISTDTLGTP